MGGAAGDHSSHRSSSPLKRPASSMDQAPTTNNTTTPGANSARVGSDMAADVKEDVDMVTLPPADEEAARNAQGDPPSGSQESIQVDTQEETAEPLVSANGKTSSSPPPIDEQIRIIEDLVKSFNDGELQEKTTAYLISRRWLAPAQALGSGNAALAAKTLPNGTLGPVDNSDIIDSVVQDINGAPAVRLKAGISQEDFEYFPKQAWDLVVSWYGLADGQLPIVRTSHNTAPNSMLPNVVYELYPPVFTLHRLWSAISGIAHDKEVRDVNQPAPVVMCSSNCKVQDFLRRAKTLLHVPMDRTVRVWRVPRKLAASNTTATATSAKPTSMLSLNTPPASPRLDASASATPPNPQDSWSKLLLEVTDFNKLQSNSEREHLTQVKDCTNDSKYNGQSTLAFISLVVDQTIVLDENIERTFWVSTYSPNKKSKAEKRAGASSSSHVVAATANTGAARVSATTATSTAASSGRSSPSNAGPVTRGRAKQKSGRTLGCVGLSNLGNSCYMNSALQCVRSVKELTQYFLVHENQHEVNHSNPLGHGGNVANAYGYLLDEIYKEPVPMSTTPRQFKSTIGRYAPAFSGYNQQDSQEFLGFLLDGLQEDLSRVKKKPYITKPDSTDEMINDPAAIREMAEQVWDITKRRDDSVIADLFTGLYKSTLVCPTCQKVSITFDPFTNLTLPLPIPSFWSKTIHFVPLNDRPVCMDVELDKNSSIRALKEFVAVRVGVPAVRLVCAEELRDGIIKIHEDVKPVSEEISNNDNIVVFEVEDAPTNCVAGQMPRKRFRSMLQIDDEPEQTPNWDSPLAERLLVPVLHRFDPSIQRPRYNKGGTMAGPPHFVVLTKEEARSEDTIRRKVLEKVASFSTWAGFAKAEEEESATDGDVVVASTSDADSAGDGKVVAKSIQGEDDMVDVAMDDAGEASSQPSQPASKVLYKFNRRRPKWVTDSSIYLGGEIHSLFDLSYYDDRGNLIPVKWVGSRDDKTYPRLHSRMPQPTPAAADRDMDSPGKTWESAGGSGSDNESSQESSTVTSDLTRMVDESDEEDSVLPAVQKIAHRHAAAVGKVAGRRKVVRHHKTYGAKGSRRRQRHALAQARHAELDVDGNENENEIKDEPETDQDGASPEPVVTPADSGPLVRLGEGIMVDWHPDAWDLIFGKESRDDTMRGEPTYVEPLPMVDDPELQEKRRTRLSRRKRGLTLDECLDEFEREEILSENDTWYCPRCKEHRRASKKFDLWKTPDILVVHLKRFSSSGWRRDKLDTRVDFPVEGLDLTKRVLDRQTGKEEVYDLIAVDDHWGGLGGGHYTAFAKNFIDDQWYEYNVNDTSRVVSAAAYLLFYRRRSDVPLGGPRFQKIEEKFNLANAESDNDLSDSGEGQRLDTGSPFNGLSSASKGAVAGLQPRAGPGLASSGTGSRVASAKAGPGVVGRRIAIDDEDLGEEEIEDGGDGDDVNDDDYLPPYSKGLTNGSGRRALDDSGDEYSGGGTAGILNFGEEQPAERVHKSIETDHGSSSNDGMDWTQPWSFGPVGDGRSGRRNSPGSDVADVDELELGDADTATTTTAQYAELMSLAGDDDAGDRDDASITRMVRNASSRLSQSPAPPALDMTAQAAMEDIQQQMWARKEEAAGRVHQVVLSDDEDANSEKAVDIHIGED